MWCAVLRPCANGRATSGGAVLLRCMSSWAGLNDVATYHAVADAELAALGGAVEALLEEVGQQEDMDVDLSQGVLTVALGRRTGTFVINKQTPTRQIWWSSPFSGPKRFDYGPESGVWLSARDGTPLRELLQQEMRGVFGPATQLRF